MKLAGSLECKELFEDIEMLFFAYVLKFRRARINRIRQPSWYQFFEHNVIYNNLLYFTAGEVPCVVPGVANTSFV